MVVRVYVSSVSGNIEIKRKQDFVLTVLGSRKIAHEQIDIADPSNEEKKIYMREHAKPAGNDKAPLPPQIFSDDQYCGNYDGFLDANENDDLKSFLKLSHSTTTEHAVEASTVDHGGDVEHHDDDDDMNHSDEHHHDVDEGHDSYQHE